jgi:hypothetical protein
VATRPQDACLIDYVTEPLVDPEVDHQWTSDRDLDRLRPLAASLRSWSDVYDRWRRHELARARPAQAAFGPADLAAIDELRGIHFGQLTAAARRWRNLAVAATRLADSSRVTSADLTAAWHDAAAPGAVRQLDQLRRDAEDRAARCERLGLELEVAIGDTAAPALRDAVHEILVRARGFERPDDRPSPRSCAPRIAELERMHRGEREPATDHLAWRAELDNLVVDYDAVLALFRANLRAARDALTAIYRSAAQGCVALQEPPTPGFTASDDSQPSVRFDAPLMRPAAGLASATGLGPATTSLAAADTSGAAAGASSMDTAGGGGAGIQEAAAVQADAGSARLGELGDLEAPPGGDQGGARLASVSGDDGDAAGCGPAAAGSSSMAAMGGAAGGEGLDDQRHGRPRPGRGDR